MEHFLSHSVMLILFDIVVILWWSYLRRMDFHIIISMEYMSNLLYIPISSVTYMAGCVSCYTRAYFPFSVLEMRLSSSHRVVIIFFIQLRDIHSYYWPQYWWFISRWAFRGAWPLGFVCLITYDSLVDCYVEVVIVCPVDYFSQDSLVDHSFEMTMGSSNIVSWARDIKIIMILLHGFMICGLRVVATCHIKAYSPSSFPHRLAFRATSSVWRLEPCFFSLTFIAIVHLIVQSCIFSLAFKVVVHSLAFKAIIHNQVFKATISP